MLLIRFRIRRLCFTGPRRSLDSLLVLGVVCGLDILNRLALFAI